MESSCFVANIDLKLSDKLENELRARGFVITRPQYTRFQAKKTGVSLTLYESGKLTVQGKDKKELIEFYLEPEIISHFGHCHQGAYIDKTARIGIDEAGKGDFFGPLCIAGVYADERAIDAFVKLGLKDSKTISDKNILILANQIASLTPYSLITLYPEKYNQLYMKFRNLNYLLAWGHATSIEELHLKTQCRTVTIDQFGGEHLVLNALAQKKLTLDLTQRHRGEEDIVVAAASIIARAGFLKGLQKLSDEARLTLPKGASSHVIKAGKELVATLGPEALNRYAKMHFKTKEEVLRA